METSKITTMIISAVVGIVLVLTALVPIVSNAISVAGDEVTYYNDKYYTFREVMDGDELVITRTTVDGVVSSTLTLNGDEIPITRTYTPIVMSDGILINVYPNSNTSTISYYSVRDNPTADSKFFGNMQNGTITIAYDDNIITITMDKGDNNPIELIVACDWAYFACPPSDAAYIASAVSDGAFVKKSSDVVICGHTDSPTTMIWKNFDDEIHTSTTGISADLTYEYQLVEGTTDIYRVNVDVELTQDGVTTTDDAGIILVPYKVVGHEDSGVVITLLSVLPIFAVIGLLASIVVFFRIKRM